MITHENISAMRSTRRKNGRAKRYLALIIDCLIRRFLNDLCELCGLFCSPGRRQRVGGDAERHRRVERFFLTAHGDEEYLVA